MENTNAPAQNSSVKTLAILSYIGNAFWALIGVLVCVASGWVMSWFGGRVAESKSKMMESYEGLDADSQAKLSEMADKSADAATGMMAWGTTIFIIAGIVIILLNVIPMLGLSRMTKGQKSGFWLYTIPTGLWAIMMLIGMSIGGIICGLVSILFIVLFGMQLKNMR